MSSASYPVMRNEENMPMNDIAYRSDELRAREGDCEESPFAESIVGRRESLRDVLSLVEAVAPTNMTVLIAGKTGTGIRSLSDFVPVLALIDKSTIKMLAVREISESKPLTETSESTRLFGLFGQAVNHFKTTNTGSVIVFGDVVVDLSSHEVRRRGQPVVLTALEFKTLKYFMQNARRAISRDELLDEVWGYDNYPCTRTVDNHILKLRQKLERDPSKPAHFRTLHGAGYKFLP